MSEATYSEAKARQYADPSMVLPEGKHCGDCVNFDRCARPISAKPYWVTCDWAPSRFRQRASAERGA